MNKNTITKFAYKARCNFDIKSKVIRLIDENSKMTGIIPLSQAIERAQSMNLDIVEVDAKVRPPICKICDYKKFAYEMKKKAKEHAKQARANIQELKIIQMHVGIEDHDLLRKCNQAKKFLLDGNLVKMTVQMRGRENNNKSLAFDVIERCIELVADVCHPENKPKLNGSNLDLFLKKN